MSGAFDNCKKPLNLKKREGTGMQEMAVRIENMCPNKKLLHPLGDQYLRV